jgi:hypothetical protein
MVARRLAVAVLAFLGLALVATQAYAQGMTWQVTSNDKFKVLFKLYSQDRNHVWPNSSEAWEISDYRQHSYPVNCQPHEKICYGAWQEGNDSTYWGCGHNCEQRCDTCCHYCDGQTVQKTLNSAQ